MLLDRDDVKFVKSSSNGKDYGVHVVVIDLKYKAKLRARVEADTKMERQAEAIAIKA